MSRPKGHRCWISRFEAKGETNLRKWLFANSSRYDDAQEARSAGLAICLRPFEHAGPHRYTRIEDAAALYGEDRAAI